MMGGPYKPCQITGCNGDVNRGGARGWCAKHYQRWQKTGDPLKTVYQKPPSDGLCTVKGCNRPHHAKGLCELHYQRGQRYGSPLSEPKFCRMQWLERHRNYHGDNCLKWPFSVSPHGRGSATLNGKVISAPRAMCILAHGEPPSEKHHAAHTCGKGHEGCMNPRHLVWKTPAENAADMIEHGTLRKGEAINTTKLTEDQVREIRRSNESPADLGRRYGVTRQSIYRVRKRLSWSWVV